MMARGDLGAGLAGFAARMPQVGALAVTGGGVAPGVAPEFLSAGERLAARRRRGVEGMRLAFMALEAAMDDLEATGIPEAGVFRRWCRKQEANCLDLVARADALERPDGKRRSA